MIERRRPKLRWSFDGTPVEGWEETLAFAIALACSPFLLALRALSMWLKRIKKWMYV